MRSGLVSCITKLARAALKAGRLAAGILELSTHLMRSVRRYAIGLLMKNRLRLHLLTSDESHDDW